MMNADGLLVQVLEALPAGSLSAQVAVSKVGV